MWFSPQVTHIWSAAIEPAINAAGYHAVRIDGVEHNNKIDDEILANIRASRFVVADFTGERGGVYFEAGFAMGLGLPVIWTVREEDLHAIHFDNRQYNFITWKHDDLSEFSKRLRVRIEATIGRGPIRF
jgi:nucleoside 2-deoxyribosyltransferase